mgnify:FL=1
MIQRRIQPGTTTLRVTTWELERELWSRSFAVTGMLFTLHFKMPLLQTPHRHGCSALRSLGSVPTHTIEEGLGRYPRHKPTYLEATLRK